MLIGRLLQGFSAGVELGGVSVYLSEMATPAQKGFYVAWQSGSQQVAIIVAAVIGYVLNKLLTPSELSDWGWRVPFFIGCLIVPFLFVIRRSLQETEEFMARKHRPSATEIFRSIVNNWQIVLAGMLLVVMTTVSFYLITVYTPTFGKNVLKLSETDRLIVTLCVGVSNFFWLPVMGALSDRVGRQPILLTFTAADHPHGLSGALLAGGATELREDAGGRAVAVVPLCQLQRRDGGRADRGHAGERAHRRASRSPTAWRRRCSAASRRQYRRR